MSANKAVRPVDSKDRLVFIDGLRGFALLGVLLANIRLMGAPSMALVDQSPNSGPVSDLVGLLSHFCLDGAFWGLFALLFGAGFFVMMGPFGSRKVGIGRAAYFRRLFMIGGLGLLHAFALWWGDILMIYAFAGLWLPLFGRLGESHLLTWAVALIAVPTTLFALLFAIALPPAPEMAQEWAASYKAEVSVLSDTLVAGYRADDFGQVFKARQQEFAFNSWINLWILPTTLGLMLLGACLARRGRFRLDPRQNPFFRTLLIWSVFPAAAGKLAYVYGQSDSASFSLAANLCFIIGSTVGGVGSALFYLCLVRRVYLSGKAVWLRTRLAEAGRMALTLYLMQSLIAGWIFYGYGLGLYGRLNTPTLLALALGIFAAQALFAQVWFAHFRTGPVEFLLRRFTYWGER